MRPTSSCLHRPTVGVDLSVNSRKDANTRVGARQLHLQYSKDVEDETSHQRVKQRIKRAPTPFNWRNELVSKEEEEKCEEEHS